MMTPDQWNELLHPVIGEEDMKKVRGLVARDAREHLATIAPGLTITTTQLLDAFYPRELAELSLKNDHTRNAIAQQLQKCATKELEDCCVKGEVNGQYMGKPKRPWLWFALPRELCPHCGQVMLEKEDI